MRINGEYPKFYMRVEGKRYAAVETNNDWCHTTGSKAECAFLFGNSCKGIPDCITNNIVYIEVPEEVK